MTVYPYASTHRLTELDGNRLLKELGPGGGTQQVRLACFEDPAREPAAYRFALGPLGIGPRCLDAGPDWVLLERLPANELWKIGDFRIWQAVARWVAQLHLTLADADLGRVPVLEHDESTFAAWRERAAAAGVPAVVLDAHARATRRLLEVPTTVIHGDLYPSNLLIEPGPPLQVWPVDWELIGRGPAVLDLAALTSGAWTSAQRTAMVDAYVDALGLPVDAGWEGTLDAARLHLCVQWLGAPDDWAPPPDHAHDWMGEALELAEGS